MTPDPLSAPTGVTVRAATANGGGPAGPAGGDGSVPPPVIPPEEPTDQEAIAAWENEGDPN